MPKMKTNRSAAKRFRVSAGGKVKHKRAFASHILTKKSTKRKRRLRHQGQVDPADRRKVFRLLP